MAPKKPASDRIEKRTSTRTSKPATDRSTPDSGDNDRAVNPTSSGRRPAPTPPSQGSVFKKKPPRQESRPDKKGKTARAKSRRFDEMEDFLPVKEGRRAFKRLQSQEGTFDGPRNTGFQSGDADGKTGGTRSGNDQPGGSREKSMKKSKRPAGLPPKRMDRDSPKKTEFQTKTISDLENSYRLNKYIANSGVCSRREADTLIQDGKVSVNGKVVTEMGVKVSRKDHVVVDGAAVNPVDFVYILLNKPKNYITTTDDEKGRSTVMDLVEDGTGHRVYPVGRLDRHTTGLLLLTNDGDLANRLMHPKYKVRKVYEIMSPQPITDEQLKELVNGVTLEDGPAQPHRVQRVPGSDQTIQVTVFEGRNHMVRRMMEAIGHSSIELARITYGGLHIKGIRNGRWRYLRPEEVNELRTLVKLFNLDKKDADSYQKRSKK
ncbi:MAG: rRNA pseudouridine synthase [Balneolales bacterium]|nr:rRNA pseudouridine synthase [Balneolales bacterium]